MIKMQVIGNVGTDAEVREVNGRKVINFSVAHNESYKDSQGVKQTRAMWVRCSYWPESVAIAPFLKKGTQVYVEGTPSVSAYETQDRRPGASQELRVTRVELLSSVESKPGQSTAPTSRVPATAPVNAGGDMDAGRVSADDDLPF